jgi:signal transduction histidine kinase
VTVSQRLYLAIVPAILGVFAVAGLAYWGRYGIHAPHVLVLVGVVASVASLIVAWRTTRYVATRLTQLAPQSPAAPTDELEAIAEDLAQLRQAVATAQAEEATAAARADASVRAYADLVAEAATGVARQVDELRMPLHILLENRFGDLNENQEEMLAAARVAADDLQANLERLGQIADIDRGAVRLRPERLRLGDLVTALLPALTAEAERNKVTLRGEIAPLLSPVQADRAALGRALALFIGDAIHRTAPDDVVQIAVRERSADAPASDGSRPPAGSSTIPVLDVSIPHGTGTGRHVDSVLAERLIQLVGGTVEQNPGETVVSLPAAPDSGVRSVNKSGR